MDISHSISEPHHWGSKEDIGGGGESRAVLALPMLTLPRMPLATRWKHLNTRQRGQAVILTAPIITAFPISALVPCLQNPTPEQLTAQLHGHPGCVPPLAPRPPGTCCPPSSWVQDAFSASGQLSESSNLSASSPTGNDTSEQQLGLQGKKGLLIQWSMTYIWKNFGYGYKSRGMCVPNLGPTAKYRAFILFSGLPFTWSYRKRLFPVTGTDNAFSCMSMIWHVYFIHHPTACAAFTLFLELSLLPAFSPYIFPPSLAPCKT